jgi:two-component system, cell cycle sensor histidine kinase and response regulator CckA
MCERSDAAPSGRTILVVEDEAAVRDCIASTLQRTGYQVLTAGDGVEGSVAFARNFERIDLLLTDISMPGMDGTELARFARKLRADIKVLFASGSILLMDKDRVSLVPGAVILNKPFTMQELLITVQGMTGAPGGIQSSAVKIDARSN